MAGVIQGVPDAVRRKALACGAGAWLDGLAALVADLEREGSIAAGAAPSGGTEAYVAERERAHWLARRTGTDAEAIGEWGVAPRVSTGLLCTQIELQPVAREMLAAADRPSA